MKILLTISFFCLPLLLFAQVGINTTSPNATLDIKSSSLTSPSPTDGLLVPKMDEFPSSNPAIAQDGMLVYVTGDGSATKGYYHWNFNTLSWTPFITGTVEQDEDWFEVGTTSSPTNITDHIYREGNISIGEDLGDYQLHVYANNSAAQMINFDFTTNASTASNGIKNTMSVSGNHTGNSVAISNNVNASGNGPVINLRNVLNASGTGSKTVISNEIPDSNISGIRTGILNNIEATGNEINGLRNNLNGTSQIFGVRNDIEAANSGATGVYNDIKSSGSGKLTANRNRFTGSGVSARIGSENFYNSNSSGTKYAVKNYFYPSNNGIQYGLFSEFASNTSDTQTGVFSEFNGSGAAIKTGTLNRFENGTNGQQIGLKNELNSTSNTSQSGVKNVFDNTGATERHGLYNEFLDGGAQNYGVLTQYSGNGNSSKNYYGVNTDFDLSSHGSTVGMRNQFTIGSNSGAAVGSINLFSGAGNSSSGFNAYGQINNFTDTNSRKIGILNSFGGSGSPFVTGILQNFSANTTSAFISGIIQNFASNNTSARDQFGLENNFSGNGTSPKVGVKNYYSFNDGKSIGFENDFRNTSSAVKKGLFNRFRSTTNSAKIGVDNDFESDAVGVQTGISNNFLSSSGQGYGVSNTSNRSSGSDPIYGVYNYFQGGNTGNKYGVYNFFPSSSGGTHYGIYSSVLKNTGYAGYFLGRVSIGTSSANRYIFPATRGANNQIMISDGVGNLSWTNNVWSTVTNNVLWEVAVTGNPSARPRLKYGDSDLTGTVNFAANGSFFGAFQGEDSGMHANGDNLEFISPADNFLVRFWEEDTDLVVATISANGIYTQSSDRSRKTNIERLDNNLQKILNLNGYRYEFINSSEDQKKNTPIETTLGIMADELQNVAPELVLQQDSGNKTINYSGIIPILIEAMKEQNTVIVQLQGEIGKLKLIEKRLLEIEQKLR